MDFEVPFEACQEHILKAFKSKTQHIDEEREAGVATRVARAKNDVR